MGASIIIGNSAADQLVIDENAEWEIARDVVRNDAGGVDHHSIRLSIRGTARAANPSSVWARIIEIDDFVSASETMGPQRIQILLDGTAERDFKPEECFASPVITSFTAFPDPGAGSSHWRYEITATVRKRGNVGGEAPETVFDFQTSVAVTTEGDKVIRKTWRARAKGASAAAAESAVKGFKPSGAGKSLLGTVERFNETNEATGFWAWELKRQAGLEEVIEWTGFGTNEDYEVDEQIGKNVGDRPDPMLILLPKGAKYGRVSGTVRGPDTPLGIPNGHYTDSGTCRRVRAKERDFPTVVDQEFGGFRRDFEELYICTGDVPTPDHGDHAAGVNQTSPPDGKLAP